MLRSLFVVLVASLPWLPAQDSAPEVKKPRVHVIGASVSGGFRDGPMTHAKEQGDSLSLQELLRKWTGEHARATTHATMEMVMMFTSPTTIGQAQIDGALRAKADVVVAIDFPFWFAYGHVGEDEAKERAELLRTGCEMLGKLGMPVLIGDLPDMQGAARRMLSPKQIPSPELLKALNEQLAAFVKEHPNVHIVPLAALVRTMKEDGATLDLASGPLKTPPGALLQGDKLHATRLGMAFLGWSIQDALRAAMPEGNPLRDQKWTFEQFVEAAGAEEELDVLKDAKAAPKQEEGAGAKGG